MSIARYWLRVGPVLSYTMLCEKFLKPMGMTESAVAEALGVTITDENEAGSV